MNSGSLQMDHKVTLTITSLLSILFLTIHHTDDIVRGMASGGLINLVVILILVVWLYGTLVLIEGRTGHVIVLVASLLVLGIPVVHMMGAGLAGGKIANSRGSFFFAGTLLALAVTASFSVILAAQGLWRRRKRDSG